VKEKILECEKEMLNVMEMESAEEREIRLFSLLAVRMTECDCDSYSTNFGHVVLFFQNQLKWRDD
jgi:hypothetical protein